MQIYKDWAINTYSRSAWVRFSNYFQLVCKQEYLLEYDKISLLERLEKARYPTLHIHDAYCNIVIENNGLGYQYMILCARYFRGQKEAFVIGQIVEQAESVKVSSSTYGSLDNFISAIITLIFGLAVIVFLMSINEPSISFQIGRGLAILIMAPSIIFMF